MGLYKSIDRKMWGDEKFKKLTPAPPNAQTLWIYLMTGDHITSLPGIFVAGEMMLSEALGWNLKGFRKAFSEVFRQGMVKADWKSRLVYLPNAKIYDSPANPNVVKHWGKLFEDLPECPLKSQIYQDLKSFIEPFSKGFHEAFEESFRKGLANPEPFPLPIPEPLPNIPSGGDDEKEKGGKGKEAIAVPPEAVDEIFDYWKIIHKHPKAMLGEKDVRREKIISRLKEGISVARIKEAILMIKFSSHHMGDNDSGAVYDDLEMICRDAKHVDQYAHVVPKNKWGQPLSKEQIDEFEKKMLEA